MPPKELGAWLDSGGLGLQVGLGAHGAGAARGRCSPGDRLMERCEGPALGRPRILTRGPLSTGVCPCECLGLGGGGPLCSCCRGSKGGDVPSGTGETSLLMDPPAGPEGPSRSQKLLPGQQEPGVRRERPGTSTGNCPVNPALSCHPADPYPPPGTQPQMGPRKRQPLAARLSPALRTLPCPAPWSGAPSCTCSVPSPCR